jgi:hypothetical protein
LIFELVGEISPYCFRVGQRASLLVTDEPFAIEAGHHPYELDGVTDDFAVDADWDLAAALQNS